MEVLQTYTWKECLYNILWQLVHFAINSSITTSIGLVRVLRSTINNILITASDSTDLALLDLLILRFT